MALGWKELGAWREKPEKKRMRKAVMGRVLGDPAGTVGLLSLDFITSVLDNA